MPNEHDEISSAPNRSFAGVSCNYNGGETTFERRDFLRDVEPQEHACTASPSVDARSTAALDDDEPGVVQQEHFRSTFGKWELDNARVSRFFWPGEMKSFRP